MLDVDEVEVSLSFVPAPAEQTTFWFCPTSAANADAEVNTKSAVAAKNIFENFIISLSSLKGSNFYVSSLPTYKATPVPNDTCVLTHDFNELSRETSGLEPLK